MTVSPAFIINGVSIPSPSNHKWRIPTIKGIDGGGNARYDPYYEYELLWNFLEQDDYEILYRTWQGTYNSGTSVANLPRLNAASYAFREYSGVVIDMPTMEGYDHNYALNIKMVIRKISL